MRWPRGKQLPVAPAAVPLVQFLCPKLRVVREGEPETAASIHFPSLSAPQKRRSLRLGGSGGDVELCQCFIASIPTFRICPSGSVINQNPEAAEADLRNSASHRFWKMHKSPIGKPLSPLCSSHPPSTPTASPPMLDTYAVVLFVHNAAATHCFHEGGG